MSPVYDIFQEYHLLCFATAKCKCILNCLYVIDKYLMAVLGVNILLVLKYVHLTEMNTKNWSFATFGWL